MQYVYKFQNYYMKNCHILKGFAFANLILRFKIPIIVIKQIKLVLHFLNFGEFQFEMNLIGEIISKLM